MKKFILVVALMILSFNVFASDRTSTTSRCSTKPTAIVTACDLKSYANSLPTSQAYALFQGYVVGVFGGMVNPDPNCKRLATDAQIIAAVKASLSALKYCANVPAQSVVTTAAESFPWVCM